jgi:hypothetical protein
MWSPLINVFSTIKTLAYNDEASQYSLFSNMQSVKIIIISFIIPQQEIIVFKINHSWLKIYNRFPSLEDKESNEKWQNYKLLILYFCFKLVDFQGSLQKIVHFDLL